MAALEVMVANDAMRNRIRENKTHQIDNVIQASREEGSILLKDVLIELQAKGVVTAKEALYKATNPKEFEKALIRAGYHNFQLAPNKVPG